MRSLLNRRTLCAVLLIIVWGIGAPSIPGVLDIWFEFGNAIPETLELSHPVLPDDVIEFNSFPEHRAVKLTRTGSYDIEGTTILFTLTSSDSEIPIEVDLENHTFIVQEPGLYEAVIDGGPGPVVVLPNRTNDIIRSSIGGSSLLLLTYLGVHALSRSRRRQVRLKRRRIAALLRVRRRRGLIEAPVGSTAGEQSSIPRQCSAPA